MPVNALTLFQGTTVFQSAADEPGNTKAVSSHRTPKREARKVMIDGP